MFGVDENIWNGYTKKEKLYVFCKKFHLLGLAQWLNRRVLGNAPTPISEELTIERNQNIDGQWDRIKGMFDDAKKQFYASIPSKNRKIVFSGHILEFDKGMCSCLNMLNSELDDTEILLLSHATRQKFAKTNSLINLNYFTLPFTFGLNRYESGVKVMIPEEVERLIREKEYLSITEERIRMRHKDMGEGYSLALLYFLYDYYCAFLDYYQPDAVILWCEFYCGHNILKDICEERGIKVLYMEFGALPGTVALESNGQMGESDVATNWEEFKEKPVSQNEIMNAREILGYLKETGLNRRVQVKTDVLQKFRKKYIPGKPIVVMFGQNDYEAGIRPYTEISRRYHSPIFESSDDAALFVEKLALENEWNYIYKPHQMMVRVGECLEESFSERTTWVGDSDINELIDIADVVITVVSQCGYVSLIREKPTIMLGYTQLRGKGCTYEVTSRAEVESTIKEALKNGYTSLQKEAFERHTAQLLKYYLFDDGLPKKYMIGKTQKDMVPFVDEQVKFIDNKKYPDRKVLFLTESECEVQGAVAIRETFHANVQADIAVVGHRTINTEKIGGAAIWNELIHEKTIEGLLNAIEDSYYTDLYVSGYENEHLILFDNMKKKNEDVVVHIFDGGDIKLYLQDINRDMNKENLRSFFQNLAEMHLYDKEFLVWSNKLNIKIYEMPETDMAYIKQVLESEKKAIYAESWLMNEGYVSNEMDLAEFAGGNQKIAVLPFCNRSQRMFENAGYTLVSEEKNKTSVIYRPLFNAVFFHLSKDAGYRFVDLSNLLSTGYPLFLSNTYKKFLDICEESKEKSDGYYHPDSEEELEYLVQCFEKNEK